MTLLRSILHDIALAVLIAAGVLACVVLYKAIGIENASTGTLGGVNTALATVNRPKSGTLSMLDDTILQGRLTLDATNKVLIHEQTQLGTLDTDIANLSGKVDTTLTALSGTATAASTSLKTLTDGISPVLVSTNVAVGQIGATVAGLQPVEKAATKSFTDMDALALNPNWPQLIENAQKVSGEFVTTVGTTNHMLFTFDAVETKATHSYQNPPHGAAAIWPTVKPFILPAVQVTGAVAIEVAK